MLVVKAILRLFELVSRLRVNFHKSEVGLVGITQLDKFLSKCLNCRQMELPFKYQGMVIGGNPKRVEFWNPIVDKIRSRLAAWKGRLLSMAGQLCLIKSILSSLPLFYLSFFKAPIDVCNQIKRIQANFLWGWEHEGRKIACVKWRTICSLTDAGGLGVKDIKCFNDALLSNWKWRYELSEKGLWRDILDARYRSWRSLDVALIHRNQSSWWKDLCQICGKGAQDNWFDCRSQWRVGDGQSVKFWDDRWVEGQVLKETFPRLFIISEFKDSLVGDLADLGHIRSDGSYSWNLVWHRKGFEWEKQLEMSC